MQKETNNVSQGHYTDRRVFKIIALIVTAVIYAVMLLVPMGENYDSRIIYLIPSLLILALAYMKRRKWWIGWLIIFWSTFAVSDLCQDAVISIVMMFTYVGAMLGMTVVAIWSPSAHDPAFQEKKQKRLDARRRKK